MSAGDRNDALRRVVSIPDRGVEREIDDELKFHLESRIAALKADGHPDDDARRIALSEFGDVAASRRELAAVDRHRQRRARRYEMLSGMGQDVRHALRALRRAPSFALAAFGTLSVGIGAFAAVAAIVGSVLLRQLPYPRADRLVAVWHDMPAVNLQHTGQSVTTYFTYRTQARSLDGIGIYKESAANVALPGGTADPARLDIAITSASLLTVLGSPASLGRLFTDTEDQVGAPPVALISDGTWRAMFGADPRVVGKRIDVNGTSREIVGVMPASFRFPAAHTAIWIPLNADPANPPKDAFTYTGVARLKAGVTLEQARRDLTSVLPRVVDLYPKFVPGISTREIIDQTKPRPGLAPLRADITAAIAPTLWTIVAAVTLLLLVACVNVGSLALVRFEARRRELAVRQAIGAGIARIARYCVTEIALIALGAGLSSLGIAYWLMKLLVARAPADIPRLGEVTVDWRSVLSVLAASVLATIVAATIPVLRIRRGALGLFRASRGGTPRREEHRTRRALVVAQVAFAMLALASSALLLHSLERLQSVRLGFEPDRIATAWVSLPASRYTSDSSVVRFFARAVDQAGKIPGVVTAAISSRVPLIARGKNENPLYPEGAESKDTKLPPLQLFTTIGGDYLQAIGVPLLAGRQFDAIGVQREGDAIVSSRTAAMFWHDATGRSVIGKRFRVLPASRLYTVVGVVGDAHDTTLSTQPAPTVYFPESEYSSDAGRGFPRTMALVLRTAGDPASVTESIQRVIRDLDPALPVFDIQPLSRAVRASTSRLRLTAMIVGGAAVVTLLLGAIGLYGVMAYIVSLRRRELGIRIALGAVPASLALATSRDAIRVTCGGVLAGLALFTVAARFIRALLFGVSPWDPPSLAAAALSLLMIALLASWLPARRAAGIDPAEALRSD